MKRTLALSAIWVGWVLFALLFCYLVWCFLDMQWVSLIDCTPSQRGGYLFMSVVVAICVVIAPITASEHVERNLRRWKYE